MGISILAFIVVLGVLIFFHELGHFLVARLFGVGVEKFSLGFGPRLIGKKIGMTDYRLSAIPLGGYVKMVGEEPDAEVDAAHEHLSFTHKHVFKRICIVAAGPGFNLLLAVLIYFTFFAITGVNDFKPIIRQVQKDSAAAKADLRKNDLIVSIDGAGIEAWSDIDEAIMQSKGRRLQLGVMRNGAMLEVDVQPELRQGVDLLGDSISYYDIGISARPELKAIVGDLSPGMPAQEAGLKKDDQITSINGIPIVSWRQMQSLISSSGGAELTLTVKRGEETLTVSLTPQESQREAGRITDFRRGIRSIATFKKLPITKPRKVKMI